MTFTFEEKAAMMEKDMKFTWDEIDTYLSDIGGGYSNTRAEYRRGWVNSKFPLFEKMGNKLRLEKKVENHFSQSDYKTLFQGTVIQAISNAKLSPKEEMKIISLLSSLTKEEIIENKILENKNCSGIKIQKGAKLSRSFKWFLSGENLDKVQIAYSKFIELKQAKGVLEFSIDPFDILMMSVTPGDKWSSCHNLFRGEYAGGPISYLLDESTAIAQIVLPPVGNDIAPNKTWRRMAYFSKSKDCIMLSKSYPSNNKNNTDTLFSLLEEIGTGSIKYGLIDCYEAADLVLDEGPQYNDITNEGVSKVPVILLDPAKYGVSEDTKNMERETIRDVYSELEKKERFLVGREEVTSPEGTLIYSGVEMNGVFDIYDEDEYY